MLRRAWTKSGLWWSVNWQHPKAMQNILTQTQHLSRRDRQTPLQCGTLDSQPCPSRSCSAWQTWRISTKYKALGSLGSHLCQTHQPHKLIDLRSPMGLRANFFRWTHLCTNLNQRIDLGAYISTSIYQRYHYMVLWCKFLTKLASGCQFPVNLLPFPKKGSFLA